MVGHGALLIFENATGITPGEIILELAGWMLVEAGYLLEYAWTLISAYPKQYLPSILAGGSILILIYILFNQRKRVAVVQHEKVSMTEIHKC